jgi:hypothetical protein
MAEFRLYFNDADDAHAAQKRVESYDAPIKTLDDVRTDMRDFAHRHGVADPLRAARKYQAILRAGDPVTIVWPASRYDDDASSPWELILEADSIQDVQQFVGVDLDYSWETG